MGGPTTTVVAPLPLAPPAPLHSTEYSMIPCAPGVTETLPLAAPPVVKWVLVQNVASVLPQLRSTLPPSGMAAKSAVTLAVTGGPTETLVESLPLAPPSPRHERSRGRVPCSPGVMDVDPEVAPPVSKPTPAQLLASVLDQVTCTLPPRGNAVKSTPRLAVTGGPTVTVMLSPPVAPPSAVQSRSY